MIPSWTRKPPAIAVLQLSVIVAAGTFGYMVIEGWGERSDHGGSRTTVI